MVFINLLTEKVIVGRLVAITGSNKTSFATVTAEYVNIQRMDEQKSLSIGGAVGKVFRLYADEGADIEEGDKLKDTDGNEYKVYSVNTPADLGNFVHLECVIFKVN